MARNKQLKVRASEPAMDRLRAAAELQGETVSEFVRRAVSERIRVVESSIEPEPVAENLAEAVVANGLCRHGLAHCRICYPRTEEKR